MAITNGYCDLATYKNYAAPSGQGFDANANDDGIIENIIEAVSRRIDRYTGRTFYARTETHYFDIPNGRELRLDDDLLTVTTFTNGDGTEITSANYTLIPYNKTPYYAIKLLDTSTVTWAATSSGGYEKALSIAGTWGQSSSTPDDIHVACLELAKMQYNRRTGQNMMGNVQVTAAGVVISPATTPKWVIEILATYRKFT